MTGPIDEEVARHDRVAIGRARRSNELAPPLGAAVKVARSVPIDQHQSRLSRARSRLATHPPEMPKRAKRQQGDVANLESSARYFGGFLGEPNDSHRGGRGEFAGDGIGVLTSWKFTNMPYCGNLDGASGPFTPAAGSVRLDRSSARRSRRQWQGPQGEAKCGFVTYEASMIRINPRIAIADDEIEFDFIRSSGPGGQNVNKVVDGRAAAVRRP